MESLEGPEELVGVGWVESGAVVTNEIGTGAVDMRLAEVDAGRWVLRCEFPGVAQQILADQTQEARVRCGFEAILDPELHPALRLGFWKLGGEASLELADGVVQRLNVGLPHVRQGAHIVV